MAKKVSKASWQKYATAKIFGGSEVAAKKATNAWMAAEGANPAAQKAPSASRLQVLQRNFATSTANTITGKSQRGSVQVAQALNKNRAAHYGAFGKAFREEGDTESAKKAGSKALYHNIQAQRLSRHISAGGQARSALPKRSVESLSRVGKTGVTGQLGRRAAQIGDTATHVSVSGAKFTPVKVYQKPVPVQPSKKPRVSAKARADFKKQQRQIPAGDYYKASPGPAPTSPTPPQRSKGKMVEVKKLGDIAGQRKKPKDLSYSSPLPEAKMHSRKMLHAAQQGSKGEFGKARQAMHSRMKAAGITVNPMVKAGRKAAPAQAAIKVGKKGGRYIQLASGQKRYLK